MLSLRRFTLYFISEQNSVISEDIDSLREHVLNETDIELPESVKRILYSQGGSMFFLCIFLQKSLIRLLCLGILKECVMTFCLEKIALNLNSD